MVTELDPNWLDNVLTFCSKVVLSDTILFTVYWSRDQLELEIPIEVAVDLNGVYVYTGDWADPGGANKNLSVPEPSEEYWVGLDLVPGVTHLVFSRPTSVTQILYNPNLV